MTGNGTVRRTGRSRWPRRITVAAVVVGLLALGAYAAGAYVVYDQASRVPSDCGGRFAGFTPAAWDAGDVSSRWRVEGFDPQPWLIPTWEDVTFPSRDPEITLHAWWMPAADPAAPLVVVVHGRSSCIRDPAVLASAGMLWHAGMSVLAVDLRDHGASTVEDGRYAGGTEEYRDALAAVDWAVSRGAGRGGIGITGNSMGAATAIIAGGEDPRIDAVWEDSSFADIVTRIADDLDQRGYPTFLAPAGPLVARLVAGDDFDTHTPLHAMAGLRGRSLAIVHGQADDATYVSHAAALAAEAWTQGVRTEVWVIPGAGHVQAQYLDPLDYQARMVRFFRRGFGSADPAGGS